MNEETIAGFLTGAVSSETLESEATQAAEYVSPVHTRVRVRDMRRPFVITQEMLLRVCDAALAGEISAESLRPIAFTIVSSDSFEWNEDLVGEVLHDWSAPEANYPLTESGLKRFRCWISREEIYPERSSAENAHSDTVASMLDRAPVIASRWNWAALLSLVAFLCSWPLPLAVALTFPAQFEAFAERQGPGMLWLMVLWTGGWSFFGVLLGVLAVVFSFRGFSGRGLAAAAILLNLLFFGFQLKNIGVP